MMRSFLSIALFCLMPVQQLSAQQHAMNNMGLPSLDTSGNYHFLVSAHFHGSSVNTSGLPAKTLLSNLDAINRERPSFLVHLGDFFLDVKNDIPTYTDTLLNKFAFPVFNAVGNHDLSGSVYQEKYGNTFFSFVYGREKFIFLDTERNDGSILGEQKDFLLAEIDVPDSIGTIFIFAHRLIWAEEHPELQALFTDNTRSSSPGNFRREILPELKKAAEKHPLILAGGSMGAVPSSFFFHREKEVNMSYIATAIRDTPRDAMLRVEMRNGVPVFSAFTLPMPPEYYDLAYYRPAEKKKAPFNWRLVPLYSKQAVTHRYFWYGIICLLVPVLVVWMMLSRKRKKKSGK